VLASVCLRSPANRDRHPPQITYGTRARRLGRSRAIMLFSAMSALVLTAALAGPPAMSATTSGSSAPASDTAPTWNLVFRDDFNGTAINKSKWVVYNNPGQRAAENVIVNNGTLKLRTKKIDGIWRPGGIGGSNNVIQTYGKYIARVRMGVGFGVRACALLWPYADPWPPEVDFYELSANDPNRTINRMTDHFGPPHRMIHRSWPGDYRQWHNVGVEWTPTALKFTLDGVVVQTITERVPAQKMWLGLQSGLGSGATAPNGTTPPFVDMEVDYVEIYSY